MAEYDPTEDTLPIFSTARPATPGDSVMLMQKGGAEVARTIALTGQDRFEFMLLYCLRLLDQAKEKNGICAFYISDFDDCDEHTLRVIQRLIGRAGYITSDFNDHATGRYQGFWGWREKPKA